MPTRSPRARMDHEIESTLHERNTRHIVELVAAWGLARSQHAHARIDDLRLRVDGSDRAHARTLADVWAR